MERIKSFFLKNTSTAQTFVKNTFWLFVGEFGSRLLKAIIFIYAARKVGVFEWGTFSYITAIIGVVITFSDIGINTIITREVAKKTIREDEYIATSFLLKTILSLAGVIVILTLTLFYKTNIEVRLLLPLAAIMFFLDSMQEFAFALNRAYEKMEVEAVSKIASNIIMVAVTFALLISMPNAKSLVYGYIAADLIATAIIFYSIRAHITGTIKKFKKNLLLPLFIEAWPIATISIFGVVLANIDTLLLGSFKHTEAVGLYAAAQKPIQLLSLIPSVISTALLPIFSRQAHIKSEELKGTIGRSINLVLLVTIPIAVGGILLGSGLITLLFGSTYAGAITIFKIMIGTIIISTPGVIVSNALFADGKQKKILQAIAIGAVTNIGLCLILIPLYGLMGAAIATTISQFIYNIFIILYIYSQPFLRFTLQIKKIIFSTVVMAICIIALQNIIEFIPLIIIAIAIYGTALLLVREPLIKDIKSALRI